MKVPIQFIRDHFHEIVLAFVVWLIVYLIIRGAGP